MPAADTSAAFVRARRARARVVVAAALTLPLAGCITLTALPRAIVRTPTGAQVRVLACSPGTVERVASATSTATAPLDPGAIRIVTWNIHKQADAGWLSDLHAFAAQSDLVLLQEAVLNAPIERLIDGAGLDWIMASSFGFSGFDIGVLTASRVPPVDSCTTRALEPLLRIPKSAVVSWFALRGRATTLAVANIHAINFSLSLAAYRAQLDALAAVLAVHDGPMILAGDLNTWSAWREAALRAVVARLHLVEVPLPAASASRFLGRQVDHVFVRGLVPLAASAVAVTSSDHNPVLATLRVAG